MFSSNGRGFLWKAGAILIDIYLKFHLKTNTPMFVHGLVRPSWFIPCLEMEQSNMLRANTNSDSNIMRS